MKTINARIKEKRMECGLTLYEVAERLGVKEATVQRYESGSIKNIKHETICKLALIFGCSPEWLMGFDKDKISEVADDIKAGKYCVPTPSKNDIPSDAEYMTDNSTENIESIRVCDLPTDLQDIVSIYLALDEKNKRRELARLYAFACELADKEQL